jgi:hypothetical protein
MNMKIVILDNYHMQHYSVLFKIAFLRLSACLLLGMLLFACGANYWHRALVKTDYAQVVSKNNLLKAKTYILYQQTKGITNECTQLKKRMDNLEALVSTDKDNVFQVNPNYKQVTVKEEVIGFRVVVLKVMIGNRQLFEYIADKYKQNDLDETRQRVQNFRDNLELIVNTGHLKSKVIVVPLGQDEYVGMIDNLIVFSINKDDAVHQQSDGKTVAENFRDTVQNELWIAKENKMVLGTPVISSIELVDKYSSLKALSTHVEKNLLLCQQYINDNEKKAADNYNKVIVFKSNFDHTPSISPLRYEEVTSPFGYRVHPITGKVQVHSGLDLLANPGTKIRATADGRVAKAGWIGGYGLAVQINHGMGLATIYGHTSQVLVSRGQYVKKGQIIALSGNTGLSEGPHVHYELRKWGIPVDPSPYMNRDIFTAKKDW